MIPPYLQYVPKQVESVKAMNIALQEKVASLTTHSGPRSEREVELEQRVERLQRQYQPETVEKRIQDMLTSERFEMWSASYRTAIFYILSPYNVIKVHLNGSAINVEYHSYNSILSNL